MIDNARRSPQKRRAARPGSARPAAHPGRVQFQWVDSFHRASGRRWGNVTEKGNEEWRKVRILPQEPFCRPPVSRDCLRFDDPAEAPVQIECNLAPISTIRVNTANNRSLLFNGHSLAHANSATRRSSCSSNTVYSSAPEAHFTGRRMAPQTGAASARKTVPRPSGCC